MHVCKVGIIGGGPGGLMTAYALQKLANCPIQLTLFEAGSRLGGKILTPTFKAAPVRYEAGAAEFYDYSQFDDDPLKELIAELRLSIVPMGGPAVVMNERVLANLDDIRGQLGEGTCHAIREFDRLAKDRMTPQEFYHSDDSEGLGLRSERGSFAAILAGVPDPTSRAYIETLIHSDLAAEPAQTSLEYGLQNYLMNDPAYMQLYGIEGGNARLPEQLAARIAGNVLLEHRVGCVSQVDGRLWTNSIHQAVEREDDFDFLVIALPHNCLESIEFRGVRLAAAMQRHRARYEFPAHYLRITILFDQPFWRDSFADSYLMLDAFGGCCLYDESSRDPGCRHGVLGWLLGGDPADRMSALRDDELIAEALKSLPQHLAHGRRHFVEGRVHRWIGAVNAIPGGLAPQNLDRRHQPEPIEHPNLFVVGDYLFDSTLNGVLDSADYVAHWLAAKLEETQGASLGCHSKIDESWRRRAVRSDRSFSVASGYDDSASGVCAVAERSPDGSLEVS